MVSFYIFDELTVEVDQYRLQLERDHLEYAFAKTVIKPITDHSPRVGSRYFISQ